MSTIAIHVLNEPYSVVEATAFVSRGGEGKKTSVTTACLGGRRARKTHAR